MTDAIAAAPPPAKLAATLTAELDWLGQRVQARLNAHFQTAQKTADVDAPPPPMTPGDAYADACELARLGVTERLVLILALAPRLRPQAFDLLFVQNRNLDRRFSEFGGVIRHETLFLPTHQTALFLLAGDDIAARLDAMPVLSRDGALARERLLSIPRDAAPWAPLLPRRRFLRRLFGQG